MMTLLDRLFSSPQGCRTYVEAVCDPGSVIKGLP